MQRVFRRNYLSVGDCMLAAPRVTRRKSPEVMFHKGNSRSAIAVRSPLACRKCGATALNRFIFTVHCCTCGMCGLADYI